MIGCLRTTGHQILLLHLEVFSQCVTDHWPTALLSLNCFPECMMNSNLRKIRRQKGKRKMKKEIKSKKPKCLLVGHQFRGLTTAERHTCTWKWTKTLSCLNCRGQAHYGTVLLGVFSSVDHCEAFYDALLIIIARNSTTVLKKASLLASWLRETKEIALYSLRYVISLVTAFSEIVCKKRTPWAQQLQMSSVICPVPNVWQLKQKLNSWFSLLLTKKCFTSAFQYGKGSAQKPQNLTSV